MRTAPRLSFTGHCDPMIAVTLRLFGWAELRRIVDQAECTVTERWRGLFSKRFEIRGTEAQMQTFLNIVWHSPDLGPTFRNELRKVAR